MHNLNMYCATEGLNQKKARTSRASRRTGKLLIMVILLFWVTSKLQTLENVRAIAIHSVPKVFWVISAVRIHTYIHLHRSRGLRSAFSVSLLTISPWHLSAVSCVSSMDWYFQLCVIWSALKSAPRGSKSTQIAHKLHQIANMLKR